MLNHGTKKEDEEYSTENSLPITGDINIVFADEILVKPEEIISSIMASSFAILESCMENKKTYIHVTIAKIIADTLLFNIMLSFLFIFCIKFCIVLLKDYPFPYYNVSSPFN